MKRFYLKIMTLKPTLLKKEPEQGKFDESGREVPPQRQKCRELHFLLEL